MRQSPSAANAANAASAASLTRPDRPVPTEGTIRTRVRYCECDPMGVAHHAAYIPWLEMGRTELLRDAGASYAAMESAGFFLVITRLEVRYRRPIRYDDLVEVRTRVVGTSRVKIRHEYELVLIEAGDGNEARARQPDAVCAAASTELACVGPGADGAGPSVRALPEWLSGVSRSKV